MSTESPASPRIAATLAQEVEKGADAAQIAELVTKTLARITAALGPVIGKGGVVALYKRSLHLNRAAHSWLSNSDDTETAIDSTALKTAFERQDVASAAAAGGALLQTFCDLLASLIGASLTERLLRAAWAEFSSAPGTQDTST